ncbi:rhodanese-like domain-containing protein [Paraflavitalea pollutisoli]|uniref:rhodanese-like domain-containing protein n=1 Tax=Paraflavitalea pollutisoli TaxID=3034143 RepID=UPI0023EB137F|nr:rhodanese-like domain-containing protein [Paraflavitalea sp. H1-2-19X]
MKQLFKAFILLFVSGTAVAQNKSEADPAAFEKGLQAKDVQLVDVRRPEEFKEGHIKGAVLANWQDDKHFQSQVAKLDKSKPVYLYCLAGVRGNKAASWLVKNGFSHVVNLEGGITAWKEAGKPIEAGH